MDMKNIGNWFPYTIQRKPKKDLRDVESPVPKGEPKDEPKDAPKGDPTDAAPSSC